MVVVNGVSGSGMEAVLNSFTAVVGDKHVASYAYTRKIETRATLPKPEADYEAYLDKLSPADAKSVTSDIEAMVPDGVWPTYNASMTQLRPMFGGAIKLDSAIRLGGSISELKPEEITKVIIVLANPKTIWSRRNLMRMQFRKLSLKYGNDFNFNRAMTMQFRETSAVAESFNNEFKHFKEYVNNCLSAFGDKVEFVSGESDILTFTNPFDGKPVTVVNRNLAKHPAMDKLPKGAPVPVASTAIFDSAEYGPARAVWAELELLVASRISTPIIYKYDKPTTWFCMRLQRMVKDDVCLRCVASQGDNVIADALVGWDREPCAYEVAYGPEPHKTIEQSINEHNWGILP